jgi:precorrin isomerase
VVHEYVNNGSDIYRESFRIIRSEAVDVFVDHDAAPDDGENLWW